MVIKKSMIYNVYFRMALVPYDYVLSNIPLYLKEFAPSTKVTFSSEDLKYLKDSIINLWEMGITDVAAKCSI